MSLEEQVEKCMKIHDILAEFWNWAYYDTSHRDCSWLLSEYVKKLKPDVQNRVPVMMQEMEESLKQHHDNSFSFLDVGCGVGGFLDKAISSLSEKFPNIKLKATGIDLSREMIKYASKNLHDLDVELVCDNIINQDLKFKNEPFDVAILMVTLAFYDDENAKEVLYAVKNKLKGDGTLLFMDFAQSYKWRDFSFLKKPLQRLTNMFFSHLVGEPFHFHNRSEDHLKTLLKDTGFDVTMSYLSEKKSKMKGMLVIAAKKETPEQELPVKLLVSEHA